MRIIGTNDSSMESSYDRNQSRFIMVRMIILKRGLEKDSHFIGVVLQISFSEKKNDYGITSNIIESTE